MKTSIAIIFLVFSASVLGDDWVFGYDLLMNSRYYEQPVVSTPAQVQGYARSWNVPSSVNYNSGLINSAYQGSSVLLGVDVDSLKNLNGVAYQVNSSQLANLDLTRPGYNRTQLDIAVVIPLYAGTPFPPGDSIWLYVLNDNFTRVSPSATNLITYERNSLMYSPRVSPTHTKIMHHSPRTNILSQSYLDIVLSACLVVDALIPAGSANTTFSYDFIQSTAGWNTDYWVNDRVLPRRPSDYVPNVLSIDNALASSMGLTSLNKIPLDDPGKNLTQIDLVTQHTAQLALHTTQLAQQNDTLSQQNDTLSQHYALISAQNTSINNLHTNVTTLSNGLNNLSTVVQDNRALLDQAIANETLFESSTAQELAAIKNNILLLQAENAALRKDLTNTTARVQQAEDRLLGLLTGWIVSLIIIAMLFIGLSFFFYKKTQQAENSYESIPLRPSRGYSYT